MDRRHEVVLKNWGREIVFENNDMYCGKELLVHNGMWSSNGNFHYHKIKDETFYVINGTLQLDIVEDGDIKQMVLRQGDSFRVPPELRHRFTSISEFCIFIETSTPHSDDDSYREPPPEKKTTKKESLNEKYKEHK